MAPTHFGDGEGGRKEQGKHRGSGEARRSDARAIPATDDPKIIAATTHRPCAER